MLSGIVVFIGDRGRLRFLFCSSFLVNLLSIAVLWNRTCRVDRRVDNLADLDVVFVVSIEFLPVVDTL